MGDANLDQLLEHDMTEEQTTEKAEAPKAKPKRIAIEHPKMAGKAHVWKTDIDKWTAKGWKRVSKAGKAD